MTEPNPSTGYYIHSNQKMRYKGTFRPQYVLDPESHVWHPLDGELIKKLDQKPYVSLSREQREAESSKESESENEAGAEVNDEVNDEEVSLFDLHMPGVLTVEETKALDLDHWLLLVHGSFVHMIVCPFPFFGRLCKTDYCRIWWDGSKCPWRIRSRSKESLQSWRRLWDRGL